MDSKTNSRRDEVDIDLEHFQELSDKISDAKTEMSKAEGVLESLSTRLKKEFEIDNVDIAEKNLEEMKSDLSESRKKLSGYIEELEKVTDWE